MMPNFVLDDDLWEKAKKIVRKEYGLSEKDGEEFWKLVTGVYKQGGGRMKKPKTKKSVELVIDLRKSADDLKL